ncbi:MAG: SRPBCC family protein [Opitutaceae bacterium]|nr:SRPBCC family protein [Opitutaceae bacterium]
MRRPRGDGRGNLRGPTIDDLARQFRPAWLRAAHAVSTSPPDDCAIVSARGLAAPRERVFAAFSDPAVLALWWGPRGFTNEFHEFDFRPGGAWRFTMRGPDGAAYAMDQRFLQIVAPERIVVRHSQPGHDFSLAMTLAETDGGTELTWRMLFDDPAEAARLREFIAAANEQNLDRLAAVLAGAQ